jgi:hypothetical protein
MAPVGKCLGGQPAGHAAPNAVAELLDAGATLRQAQQAAVASQPGAACQLRTATAHLRAAITRLSRRAETLLVRSGHAASDATLARLAATLQAAATGDEATRAALAGGRLPKDLDPAGFGLDLAPVQAEPTATADAEPAAVAPADQADAWPEQARTAARRAMERTRQAAEQAQAVLDQAQAQAANRQQAALAARQRAEELSAKPRSWPSRRRRPPRPPSRAVSRPMRPTATPSRWPTESKQPSRRPRRPRTLMPLPWPHWSSCSSDVAARVIWLSGSANAALMSCCGPSAPRTSSHDHPRCLSDLGATGRGDDTMRTRRLGPAGGTARLGLPRPAAVAARILAPRFGAAGRQIPPGSSPR